MSLQQAFPRLTAHSHRVTSPPTSNYNCIAWSVGETGAWWQPGTYWPLAAAAGDLGIGILLAMFLSLGYEECADSTEEPAFDKIALYADDHIYTHAARQLPGGMWTSKLGKDVDIEHDRPEDVTGGLYGSVVGFVRRSKR